MDFLSVVFVPFIWKADPCSEVNFVGNSFLMADQNLSGELALSLRISWWYLLLHLLIRPVTLSRWRLYVDQSCSQLTKCHFNRPGKTRMHSVKGILTLFCYILTFGLFWFMGASTTHPILSILIAPARISPRSEIPRRHPSSSRVY